MGAPPFTHHEIIGLVGPFARRGRHVDLERSNRIERRLVFRSVNAADRAPPLAGLSDTLLLDHPEPGEFKLTRRAALADGFAARLEARGADAEALLQRVEAIDAARQFRFGAGFVMALDRRLEAGGAEPILSGAVLRLAEMTLTLRTDRSATAQIELAAEAGIRSNLPDDILAVLGWRWSRLRAYGESFRGQLRLRGREPQRSEFAVRELERAAVHLAATLAQPPARYHERWRRARWSVYGRSAIPLLACAGLIAAAAAVPRLHLAQDSALRMLIFNAPPLLMAMLFCMREIPRIEIPPLPRRLAARAWRKAPD